MDPESARIEHLKLIQDIIARLGRNSFAIKAVAATVVAAVIAATVSSRSPLIAAYAGLPVAMFWMLDAFYLLRERRYRKLYDLARRGSPPEPGDQTYFSMSVDRENQGDGGLIKIAFSATLLIFYVSLLAILALAAAVESLDK